MPTSLGSTVASFASSLLRFWRSPVFHPINDEHLPQKPLPAVSQTHTMGGPSIDHPNRQTNRVISIAKKMGHRLVVASLVVNAIKRDVVTNGVDTRQFPTILHHHSLLNQSKSLSTTLHGLSGDGWSSIPTYVPPDSSLTRFY